MTGLKQRIHRQTCVPVEKDRKIKKLVQKIGGGRLHRLKNETEVITEKDERGTKENEGRRRPKHGRKRVGGAYVLGEWWGCFLGASLRKRSDHGGTKGQWWANMVSFLVHLPT